jgi:hypothetical protein
MDFAKRRLRKKLHLVRRGPAGKSDCSQLLFGIASSFTVATAVSFGSRAGVLSHHSSILVFKDVAVIHEGVVAGCRFRELDQ